MYLFSPQQRVTRGNRCLSPFDDHPLTSLSGSGVGPALFLSRRRESKGRAAASLVAAQTSLWRKAPKLKSAAVAPFPIEIYFNGGPVLLLLKRALFCLLFCGQDNSEWGPRQNNVLLGRGDSGLRSSFAVIGKVSVQSRESTIGLRRIDKLKVSTRATRFCSITKTVLLSNQILRYAQDDLYWRCALG